MANYYLETSALAKLYVREAGTDEMLRLVSGAADEFYVSSLARVEVRSAMRRLNRAGTLRAEALAAAAAAFDADSRRFFKFQAPTDSILESAVRLVDGFALRAYDAIQLATCAFVAASGAASSPPVFVCSDQELLRAARQEGLEALDPAAPAGAA